MSPKKSVILLKVLGQAEKAASWLTKSYEKCRKIDFTKPLSEPQFDAVENLTSRYARLTDILINKLFRALDEYELEPQKTVIDVIRKAAKRSLGEEQDLRALKELRNAIAHDYAEDELVELFKAVRDQAPLVLQIFEVTKSYVQKLVETD